MNTRLEKFYKDEVVPKLMEKFGYTNPMQVPRLTKITLNMGVGEAATNKKILENAVADMAKVAGQKPNSSTCRLIRPLLWKIGLSSRPESVLSALPLRASISAGGW